MSEASTVPQLQQLLKSWGLPSKGSKAVLWGRIRDEVGAAAAALPEEMEGACKLPPGTAHQGCSFCWQPGLLALALLLGRLPAPPAQQVEPYSCYTPADTHSPPPPQRPRCGTASLGRTSGAW